MSTSDPFLLAAIEEARAGEREGGIPIGSVLVHRGRILGGGHNRRVQKGSAILRIDAASQTFRRVAGTGEQGYAGDGGPALQAKLGGPKGLALTANRQLYVADTENHVIRRIDLSSGVIATVLGTGQRGDGPETDPLMCRLARPHGVLAAGAKLYVADSEAHRIRVLE